MAVLERVREYLSRYPGLENLQVDCLPGTAGGFSLNAVATEPVEKTYLDGSRRKLQRFTLWGRRGYGADVDGQQENLRWFADFARWLEEQAGQGILPELDSGQRALSLGCVDTAALETTGENGLGCYQVTLQLGYFETT